MITKTINEYDSSTVKSSEYDYKTKNLTISFHNTMYTYHEVSLVDYMQFANATSQGKMLNKIIKPQYSFTKTENEVIV